MVENSKNCPLLEKCVFFQGALLPEAIKNILVNKYCKADYSTCERKKLRDKGEKPPSNMVPDGRIIGQADTTKEGCGT